MVEEKKFICFKYKSYTSEEKLQQFGTKNTMSLIVQQAVPNLFALISLCMYGIVDSIYIGKYLPESSLAAMSVANPLESLFINIVMTALSVGAVSVIGPTIGAGKIDHAKICLTNFLYVGLVFCVLIPAIFLPWMKTLISLVGASTDDVKRQSYDYALWMFLFGPIVYLANGGMLPVLRTENRTTLAMVIQIASSIICIILDSVMFPTVGKQLEMKTALISTIAALTITGIYSFLNFSGVIKKGVMKFKAKVVPDIKIMWSILKQSFPQYISSCPTMLGSMICNSIIKSVVEDMKLSEKYIAAVGIYIRISFFGLQPRYAIYIAFMSIVGFNIGAKAYKRVQKIMVQSFLLIFGIVFVLTVFMVVWASEIASIFTSDAEFAKITGDMSIWGLIGNPFNGPLVLASGIYQMEGKSL